MTLMANLLTNVRTDIKDYLETVMLFGNIGNDSSAPSAGDTGLTSETFRDDIDEFDKSVADAITASLRILTTEANGTVVREVGWNDTDQEDVDDCEATTGWADSADMTVSLNTSTFLKGLGSINLTKDNTGSATASTSKTTPSLDFTSKTLILGIYISDAAMLTKIAASNGLTIRFGSGAGDYYEWTKDQADLAVGWNIIGGLTTGTASTTGSPVITACDYTYVAPTATGAGITWSDGDVMMDDIRIVGGGTQLTHSVPTAINKTDSIQLYLDTTITIAVV